MERRIFKFAIEIRDLSTIFMPRGSVILHVGAQNDNLFMWAICDINAQHEARHFAVTGTGLLLPPDLTAENWIGSALLFRESFVAHVFEVNPSPKAPPALEGGIDA
jgi:hypothetical protein